MPNKGVANMLQNNINPQGNGVKNGINQTNI